MYIIPQTIINVFFKQSNHRMDIETKNCNSQASNIRIGLIFGFVLALVCILGGIYLCINGKESSGITLITISLSYVLGSFIYGGKVKNSIKSDIATTS